MRFPGYTHLKILFIILFTAAAMTGCSDDPISDDIDDSTPPSFPELIPYEVNTDYFDEGMQQNPGENFLTANSFVQVTNTILMSQSQFAMFYFGFVQDGEIERDGNTWIWIESVNQGGESFEARAEMKVQNGRTVYELYLSGNVFEKDETVENFLFIDGYEMEDQSEGGWNLYQPEPEGMPKAEYSYESNDVLTLSAILRNDDGTSDSEFTYVRDGSDHKAEIALPTEDVDINVFWNSDTEEGYYTRNGELYCWGQNLQDTEC